MKKWCEMMWKLCQFDLESWRHHWYTSTCKMQNEIETKFTETKRNLPTRNEIERKRFVSFRWISFRFISFRFVSFRFGSISFRILQIPKYYAYEKHLTHIGNIRICIKIRIRAWCSLQQRCTSSFSLLGVAF
jgi:hypothetical protein